MFKIAKDKDEVLVKMLCVAYAYELQAYHSYLHAYTTVTGPLESVYGELYKEFMDKELHHLEEVGKKIRVMGGVPPIEYPSIELVQKAIYKGYDATITALQAGENKALEIYGKIHAAADKVGDLPLVLLIEEIMQEEEEHHDELERILMDVPGKNNIEMHDKLEVDAFEIRHQKVANLFVNAKLEDVAFLPIGTKVQLQKQDYDGNNIWLNFQSDIRKRLIEKDHKTGKNVVVYVVSAPWRTGGTEDIEAVDYEKTWRLYPQDKMATTKYATVITDNIVVRANKIAELMDLPPIKNEVDMNRYAGRWMKINKDIVKLLNEMGIDEDDVGIIDYNDEAYPELLRNLMRQRDAIQDRLSGYDSSWLIGYMEDESKEEKPIPQDEGKQEKQFEGVKIRKKKLAALFIEAGMFDGYTVKQLQDEDAKLKAEIIRLWELAPEKDGVRSIDDNVPELKKIYLEVDNRRQAVLDEMERRELLPPRRVNIWKNDKQFKTTYEDAPPTINDGNMEAYIKKWVKLNNEINDMEDENYGEDHPEMRKLMRERKNIEKALDDFDDNWMRDFFGDEEPMDEVESVETMRDYR